MVDLNYLKTTTENDQNIIRELLTLFLDQLPGLEKNILDAYENKNWKALREAAHKAKSSFQIIGAYTQAEELKQMEMMTVEDEEKPEYETLINNFKNSCNQVIIELKEIIKHPAT